MTIQPQTVYRHFRQGRCPRRFVVSIGEHLDSEGRPWYGGPTVKYHPLDRHGFILEEHICRLQAFEAWARHAEINEASTAAVLRNPGTLRGIIAEPTAYPTKGEVPS